MLKVQEYLRKFDNVDTALDSLYNEFGIANKKHDDGRVILDYDQITSPKFNPIVRECRGLVLDYTNDWKLVARSFYRFFNHGEGGEENKFSAENMTAADKEDGSMILLYFFKGEWRVNTRFSFADSKVNDSEYTWEELFWLAAKNLHKEFLIPGRTYVFELCSIYNKVVRHYAEPKVYLLGTFTGDQEDIQGTHKMEAYFLGVEYPKEYFFKEVEDVVSYIKEMQSKDPTYEGLVLRDTYGRRLKVKSPSYLVLHKKLGNRKPTVEDLYSMSVEDDGGDEFLTYFPEIAEKLNRVKVRKGIIMIKILGLFNENKDLPTQKDFALAVKDHECAFGAFALKKGLTIEQVMVEYSKRIAELIERDLNDNPPQVD